MMKGFDLSLEYVGAGKQPCDSMLNFVVNSPRLEVSPVSDPSRYKRLKRNRLANRYWISYNRCFIEARNYNSRTAFHKGCVSAYTVALKKGWINDYKWFITKEELCRLARTKWTYSACWNLASKCTTKSEFKKESYGAWEAACRNGWINEYTWFKNGKIKWDYEACFSLAKCCHTLTELAKKNDAAYYQARKNGWVKDYFWFFSTSEARKQGLMRSGIIKWDYDKVRKAALSCETLRDFATKYGGAYNKALKNKWIDEFEWLVKGNTPFEKNRDNVYAYFFQQAKAVYVGRSVNCHRRDREHREGGIKDAVSRFASETGVPIPPMKILERNLSLLEGKSREHQYIVKFKTDGWQILNRGRTGSRSGSLGALGAGKWNYKNCFNEASKYRTLSEFIKGAPSAYNAAREHKWLTDYVWLLREKGKWTFEAVCAEARKYSTANAFKRGNVGAYDKAMRRGWLKEFNWFRQSKDWSYERCYEEAKKCETRVDFKNRCAGGYTKAVRKGWMKDYFWLKPNRRSKRSIVQIQQNGKVVGRYISIREAAKYCNIFASGIVGCLKGRYRTSGGFIWQYADVIGTQEKSLDIVRDRT